MIDSQALVIIIPVLSALDVIVTYYLVKLTKSTDIEINPLAKLLWNRLGVFSGSFVGFFITVLAMLFLVLVLPIEFRWVMVGAYGVVFFMHYEMFLRFTGMKEDYVIIQKKIVKELFDDVKLTLDEKVVKKWQSKLKDLLLQ